MAFVNACSSLCTAAASSADFLMASFTYASSRTSKACVFVLSHSLWFTEAAIASDSSKATRSSADGVGRSFAFRWCSIVLLIHLLAFPLGKRDTASFSCVSVQFAPKRVASSTVSSASRECLIAGATRRTGGGCESSSAASAVLESSVVPMRTAGTMWPLFVPCMKTGAKFSQTSASSRLGSNST